MKRTNVVRFNGNIEYLDTHSSIRVRGYLEKNGKVVQGRYYVDKEDFEGGTLLGTLNDDSVLALNTFRQENGVDIMKSTIRGVVARGPLVLQGTNGPGNSVRWSIALD